jgi:hypothetical protein
MSARRPRRARGAVLDDADHAGGAHAAVHRDAPFGELGGHHVGGALLLEAEFGMGVDVAPHGGDGRGLGDDGVEEFMGVSGKPAGESASLARRKDRAMRGIRDNGCMADFPFTRALELAQHAGALQHRQRQLQPALIHFIRDELAKLGVKSRLSFNAEKTKANLFATLGEGKPAGLILSGHTDTVPWDGQDWTVDPLGAVVRTAACTAAARPT